MSADNLPTAAELLLRMRAAANPDNVAGMMRYGISGEGALGVSMPYLRGIAREMRVARRANLDGAHALAAALWDSRVHEARILAALVDVPALVTSAQADRWAAQIDSWDVCDQLCSNLLGYTSFAYSKVDEWAAAQPEFVKRAGFVLICALTVHDKKTGDEPFLHFLTLIEREAGDERNFVKKAVNWALRQIGKRNRNLHAAAVALARRLRESESKAARWVASDALRELSDEKVIARLRS
jgi:3-methyladenine DNA glycosylase AlkD